MLHICKSLTTKFGPRPDETRKKLDANVGSGGLLLFQSYGKFCSMLEDARTVETTPPCFIRENVSFLKQRQNFVRISSEELKESLLNDCKEGTVDYVAGEEAPQCWI